VRHQPSVPSSPTSPSPLSRPGPPAITSPACIIPPVLHGSTATCYPYHLLMAFVPAWVGRKTFLTTTVTTCIGLRHSFTPQGVGQERRDARFEHACRLTTHLLQPGRVWLKKTPPGPLHAACNIPSCCTPPTAPSTTAPSLWLCLTARHFWRTALRRGMAGCAAVSCARSAQHTYPTISDTTV